MRHRALTLFELLVVLTLLALVTVLAVPALRHSYSDGPGSVALRMRSQAIRLGQGTRTLDTLSGATAGYVTPDGLTLADTATLHAAVDSVPPVP